MKCKCHAATILIAVLITGFEVHAATLCAAGNPNTTSLLETTPTSAFMSFGPINIHNLTGLMWKTCPEGMDYSGGSCSGTTISLDWKGALEAANRDTTSGFANWRLPNIKELLSIVEYCGYAPAINQVVFPGTPSLQFWSSTTDVDDPFSAATVDFSSGESTMINDKSSSFLRVRLVRGGDSVSAFDFRAPPSCSADFDGNGAIDPLTDGLLFFRATLGMTGTAVTNGAVGLGATRDTWAKIRAYMNGNCGTSFAL